MRITIIGAGFAGSALAIQLLQRRAGATEVCLVGAADSFGRGVAYGTPRPEHYLNVEAGRLGLDAMAIGDFADWLQVDDHSRSAYVPRHLYGEYLSQRLDEATGGNAGIHRYAEEVISVERRPHGFQIYLADGSDFRTDIAVLAVGALPPAPLPALDVALHRHPAYVGWPWRDGVLDAIQPDSDILLVGTGLTMVDVLATLRRNRHRGSILAISRHGQTPAAHVEGNRSLPPPPALQRLLASGDPRALLRGVRELIRVAPDWRGVIDGLRPYTQQVWQRWNSVERSRFLRHVRSYWERHRHRIAPGMDRLLREMTASGQLRIEAAHLLHARANQGEVEALLRPRGASHSRRQRFGHLIRATGLDTDITRTTHALIAHLRESGLIAADPFGLGLRARADYTVLDASGRPVDGLYCLGPLLRGERWEFLAIPELRAGAAELAQILHDRLPAENADPATQTVGTDEPEIDLRDQLFESALARIP